MCYKIQLKVLLNCFLLSSFSLTDVLMADWPSRDFPKDSIGVDFEVTLTQYQLCELNLSGCNAGLNWKKSFSSSSLVCFLSSHLNFESPYAIMAYQGDISIYKLCLWSRVHSLFLLIEFYRSIQIYLVLKRNRK